MTLEIEKRPSGLNFSAEKIQLLKDTVCKGASDSELELFLHVCKHTGLDPFMKQIYSIPRGGQRTIQTSIDGFRLIAERTGRYAPGKESTFVYDEKGSLISSTSWVKKMTADGTWHEVAATAFMNEFKGPSPFWTKLPHVMLAKCAEAAALRRAFPAELAGVYAQEEMEQAEVEVLDSSAEVKTKEDLLLTKISQDKKEIFVTYLETARAHFKKTKKNKWPQDWIAILDMYELNLEKFNTDVNHWHEKQLAKKENLQ
jgi:phage recombination protein Bet